jgi:hypothetical protein
LKADLVFFSNLTCSRPKILTESMQSGDWGRRIQCSRPAWATEQDHVSKKKKVSLCL